MNNAISNNPNYDMPDDSFFNFYFLIHKNRIFTTKIALKVGEITTALLNMKAEDMKKIYDLTVSFAGFADNNMAMKNEQTMTEFVDRIIEIEQIAVTLPPYCYVNIDLKKEKQRAEIMKSKAFYGRLYDMTSEEFAEYERYKKLFSGYGIGLYIIACCIAEMSDEYFTRLKKRDESNYAIAWGAFNEYSTLSSELMASVPYYEKTRHGWLIPANFIMRKALFNTIFSEECSTAERLFAVTTADVFSLRLTATRRFTAMKSLPKIPTEPAVRLARKTSTRKRLRTIRLSRPTTRRGTNIISRNSEEVFRMRITTKFCTTLKPCVTRQFGAKVTRMEI